MTRAHLLSRCFAPGVAVLGLLSAPDARAYCRATPCDPSTGTCKTDKHGCSTEGPHLYWPNGRVHLSVDGGGSPLRGISGDDAAGAVSEALGAWQVATCDDGAHPALSTKVTQVAAGATAEFLPDGPYENVVLFRDAVWPYEQNAVAKTTLGVNLDSGEILDADIQLDSEKFDLSLTSDAGGIDLVAVLTHEIGHVLGLGHSDVKGATMQPETTGFGTVDLRTLEADDVAGICAIYARGAMPAGNPAGPGDPSGASSSCSLSRPSHSGPAQGWVLIGLPLIALARRIRARTRHAPRGKSSRNVSFGAGIEV